MGAPPLSPDRVAEIVRLAAGGASKSEAARRTGLNRTTVTRYWPADGAAPAPVASEPPPAREFSEDVASNTAVVVQRTDRIIETLEDAIAAAGVDLSVWRVKFWEKKTWTVAMRVRQGQDPATKTHRPDVPIQTQQHGVRLVLERILPIALAAALDLVFARFKDAAPRWPKIDRERPVKDEPFMAVFGLFDVHFGKLAWAPETGEHYDLRIAEAMFRHAVEDLIAESRHRRVSKVLLPVGNDWFHVDNRTNSTTRGTPQDVDGRFSKMLATGKLAAVWAVEAMAAVAPVQVELVPGNHDRTLAECLCHILDARFHHTDRVTVGMEPKTRKYVRFGSNLIGLAHGDLVKPPELPNLMAVDAKRDWAETDTHEWLTGHGHRAMKWTEKDTDTHRGTVVRQLRALTRTDLWHFDKGYCRQQPGAEVYWYGRDRGYAGHSVVPARVA